MAVVIGDYHFPDREEATRYVASIVAAGPAGSDIVGSDREIVEAIFAERPDPMLNLQGLNVIRYLRDWILVAPGHKELALWAELEDGRRIDFEYDRIIKKLPNASIAG
jgi:hypothetical protein